MVRAEEPFSHFRQHRHIVSIHDIRVRFDDILWRHFRFGQRGANVLLHQFGLCRDPFRH